MNFVDFDEEEEESKKTDESDEELSLISNGAEVLMLHKDVFLKYSNDSVKQSVIKLTQPYPDTSEMQLKLQHFTEWNKFKALTMNEAFRNLKRSSISTNLFGSLQQAASTSSMLNAKK